MSNGTDTPFGLSPLRTLDGSDLAMASGLQCTIYEGGYDTNLIPGDPVTFSGTGNASGPGIVRATAGAAVIGVFGGLLQQVVNTTPAASMFQQVPSYVANTTSTSPIIAWVYTDPNIVYAIQTGAVGIQATDLGNNANFAVNAGSLVTNTSGVVLNQGTIANTATLNLKILGLADSNIYPGNKFYVSGVSGSYNVVEVLINNHVFKGGTGTAGI
jgi:hypothetical protein